MYTLWKRIKVNDEQVGWAYMGAMSYEESWWYADKDTRFVVRKEG